MWRCGVDSGRNESGGGRGLSWRNKCEVDGAYLYL